MRNIKRWNIVFRALANVNRLKIIDMLSTGNIMNVTDISKDLGISFKATSNHLAILKNLDVLNNRGVDGHVFYSLNEKLSEDFNQTTKLFLK